MKHPRQLALAMATAMAAISMAGCAHAQQAEGFTAPRISADYLAQMATLPDWTGTWAIQDGIMFDPYAAEYVADDPNSFGRGVGVGSRMTEIPLTPEYMARYEDFLAALERGESRDPVGSCMQPHAMPRQMGGTPGGPEIIMLPGQVRMTWRHHNATRRIHTDGRPLPSGDDLVPSYMGYSVGHWEGDMLIVETVGMMPGIYDQTGAPYSDQVRVTERMKMVEPDVLYVELTITDPVALTQPWVVTRKYHRTSRNVDAEGQYCEGQRLEYRDGVQTVVLPDDEPAE